MSSFLEFTEVTHRFGKVTALNNVSLGVREGEIFGLLGPSGCGKTTLLRIAGGFCHPSQGSIHLNGKDITHLPPEKRPLNTVFQNYALFPHLTVWENLAFGLRMAKKSAAEIRQTVSSMLSLIQMDEHAQKMPDEISGGQRQRVAIGRALVNRPQVLLLDEPLAALDLKLRQRMLDELSKIHQQVGTTFLFVTHDQGEALSLCDRIAVMNEGRVEQIGTPKEIYETPASAFVASFIGDTNFLQATVNKMDAEGSLILDVPGFPQFRIQVSSIQGIPEQVLLGLRPERITMTTQRPSTANGLIYLEVEVVDVTFMGQGSRYSIRSSDMILSAHCLHDRWHDQSALRKGAKAWAEIDPGDFRLVKESSRIV